MDISAVTENNTFEGEGLPDLFPQLEKRTEHELTCSPPQMHTTLQPSSPTERPSAPTRVKNGSKQPQPKKSHARKQPNGHIPRPRNAFILFRKHITVRRITKWVTTKGAQNKCEQDNDLIPTSVEVKHQNISVVAAKMWSEAPPSVKTEFANAAKLEKEEHARLYPNYRYQPAFRRTDIVRRRVRKDPNEDAKCEAVASLLIQGATGEVLETEVKESLAQTAPEPVHPGQIKLVTKKGRRRRKDAPGELSKGALRAQKAAARAKAMREQWMDTNHLLNHLPIAPTQGNSRMSTRSMTVYPGSQREHERVDMQQYDAAFYDDGYDLPPNQAQGDLGQNIQYQNIPMLGEVEYADGYRGHPVGPMDDGLHNQFSRFEPSYSRMPEHEHFNQNEFYPPQQGYPDQQLYDQVHALPPMQQYPMDTIDGGRPFSPQSAGFGPMQPQRPGEMVWDNTMGAQEIGSGRNDLSYHHLSTPRPGLDQLPPVDPFLQPLGLEFQQSHRPGDIVAGRWAQELDHDDWNSNDKFDNIGSHNYEQSSLLPFQDILTQDHNERLRESNRPAEQLFPFIDHDALPSEGLDLGTQPRLFDDLWDKEPDMLPLDPDMEYYQEAVREQDEMEMLAAR